VWILENGLSIRTVDRFCPLTAISFARTGKIYGKMEANQNYVDVGIELKADDRYIIMDAADSGKSYMHEYDKECLTIRNTMLRILGLRPS
jgi:hypothetical protein